jgi:hypothetical protein
MPKVELLPVTYDSEALLMWADENFRRTADAIASLKASDIGGGIFGDTAAFTMLLMLLVIVGLTLIRE